MTIIARNKARVLQQITYGLAAEVGHKKASPEQAALGAIDCINDWIATAFPYDLPAEAARRDSFTMDEGGHRVEAIAMLDAGLWSIRWSHPDIGIGDDCPPVPGRHWTIDVGIRHNDNKSSVAVRISCATPENIQAPIRFVRPKVIPLLAQHIGLKQRIPLQDAAWTLDTEDDLVELKALLTDPERRMPVFLISEVDKRKWDYTPHPPKFMVNGHYLARKALGYAHVVQLPYMLGFEWTRQIGVNWAAFDGAVRLYMPGLDFLEDIGRQHPMAFKRQIHDYAYQDKKGAEAFTQFLVDRLASYGAQRRVHWDGAVFIPEARIRLADHRARHIAQLTNISEVRERYEAQIAALRQKLVEAEGDAEQWSDHAIQADRDRDYFKRENGVLRNQIESLRGSLEAKTATPIDDAIPIPADYNAMPEWVEKYLAGRLVLHPRAVGGLKDAVYQDVPLVYKGILLLANQYRDSRLGKIDRTDFDKAAQSLELSCSGSITKIRAGEEGDTYFVRYPIGTQQKQFVDMHLRKGSSKEQRYCLGIYFFWDDDTNQVVVCWLPSHLQNRMT